MHDLALIGSMPALISQREAEERFLTKRIILLGIYVNVKTPVLARCMECSCEWMAYPERIFGTKGCPDCADRRGFDKLKTPIEEVILRYSSVRLTIIGEYVDSLTPVLTRCNDCGFEWYSWPSNIYKGQGCKRCHFTGRKLTLSEVDKRLLTVSVKRTSEYMGRRSRAKVQCIRCLYEWNASLDSLFSGHGCPVCYLKSKPLSMDEVDSRLLSLGISRLGPYVNAMTPMSVRHVCGHTWKPLPMHLFAGKGCPRCNNGGFNPDKPAILYYLCVLETFYKIGVTNRTVKRRFPDEMDKIRIVNTKFFAVGSEAWFKEQEILFRFKEHSYKGDNILSSGNRELFTFDILGLDQSAA